MRLSTCLVAITVWVAALAAACGADATARRAPGCTRRRRWLCAELALHDFDGDGVADVLRPNSSAWQWSRSGTSSWATLRAATDTRGSLGFDDFDGDGRTDVFSAQGNRWMVSGAGSSGWRSIRIASEPLSDLGFADFDGDGADDVFRTGCL